MPVIYALGEPDDGRVRYVGKAIKPESRFKSHLNEWGYTRKCRWVFRVKRQGKIPRLLILAQCTEANWEQMERLWIRVFRACEPDLLNHTDGGEGLSNFTPAMRKRISDHQKQLWKDPAHRARLITPERAAKISKALSGKKKSAGHVAKLKQNQPGFVRNLSEESLASMKEKLKGNKHALGMIHTEETRRKISVRLQGNQHTKDRKIAAHEKLAKSKTLLGRTKTAEHKAKIAAGLRRRWENPKPRSPQSYLVWPSWEYIQRLLETMTTKEAAAFLVVKPGTLSAFIHNQRKKEKKNDV